MSMEKKVVRLSVNISEEVYEALKALAEERGTSVTDILNQAVSLQKYVDEVQRGNGKILIETPKGQIREVVFQ